ncbi:SRPBCC domain-containing protein [Nocardioides sp.]|uniref:SRPBCC domain-containing protein n=1 Tax=Nocardioides sp. TaxID=35761 RepID=UPI002735AD29|nr:SRPBCC domain-containing protein [Nocardioides sp.]MDP3890805.1 SRPBCC domain-containing protein [Nocardioides sp.]
MNGLIATADVEVSASPSQVWNALTDPDLIRKYLFGAEVDTTWEPGSPIHWRGEYDGRSFEDKGEVLDCVPEQKLTVTHYSPLTGQEDRPESYHTVSWALTDRGDRTHLALVQDNNHNAESVQRSSADWQTVLDQLKELVERG